MLILVELVFLAHLIYVLIFRLVWIGFALLWTHKTQKRFLEAIAMIFNKQKEGLSPELPPLLL